MSAYTREDEERVRLQGQVREWARAGLLAKEQADALAAELRTGLRRTNTTLRYVLAFFTAIITAAAIGLVALMLSIRGDGAASALLACAAAVCFVVADRQARGVRLYRYGIEEALAAGAALCAGLSVALAVGAGSFHAFGTNDTATTAGLLAAAAVAGAAYYHFGFDWAAIAATGLVALVPFEWSIPYWLQRLASIAILSAVFGVARAAYRRHGDDYPGGDAALVEAAAWLGTYLVTNLELTLDPIGMLGGVPPARWFFWATYAAIWIMPVAGLWVAIREKNRSFLRINLVLAVLTLVTNKSYLGWPRYSWDPMILGVLLGGVAIVVRRWLATGPDGERAGYTPARILEGDRDVVSALGTVSSALHPHVAPLPSPQKPEPGFGGGRSGGGGAQGSF